MRLHVRAGHCTALNVEGDFLEAGVWRGGSSVFARAVFVSSHKKEATREKPRTVWVCDSFEGLPLASTEQDSDFWASQQVLAVSAEQVIENFERFGLMDERRVRLVKGYFQESLPAQLPADLKLSVLRLDGDMYESTVDTLFHTYAAVSIGGFVIVDDYCLRPCQRAVDQFRELHAIDDTMVFINGCQTYWRKQKPVFGEEMRRGWYEQFNAARKSRLNDPKPGSAEEIGILGVPRAYAN